MKGAGPDRDDGRAGIEWRPDEQVLSALHDAVRDADREAYLLALLDASLVMPTDATREQWAVVPVDGRAPCVTVFSSVEALRQSPAGTAPSHIVWPVIDLLHAWPDPGWALLIDAGLPTQVLMEPEMVAELAERAVAGVPLDAAVRAAGTDLVAYLEALLAADVVVPLDPRGSSSRDLSDPEFAWLRIAADADASVAAGAGIGPSPAIVLFSVPVRLQSRFGDVPYLQAPFTTVLEYWPDGHSGLVDPGHHVSALLPAEAIRSVAVSVRDALWEAKVAAGRILEGVSEPSAERLQAARDAALQAVIDSSQSRHTDANGPAR
ncbi:MAG: SseB family protein [Frankia sp.]